MSDSETNKGSVPPCRETNKGSMPSCISPNQDENEVNGFDAQTQFIIKLPTEPSALMA